jgi:hypothetical protein
MLNQYYNVNEWGVWIWILVLQITVTEEFIEGIFITLMLIKLILTYRDPYLYLGVIFYVTDVSLLEDEVNK